MNYQPGLNRFFSKRHDQSAMCEFWVVPFRWRLRKSITTAVRWDIVTSLRNGSNLPILGWKILAGIQVFNLFTKVVHGHVNNIELMPNNRVRKFRISRTQILLKYVFQWWAVDRKFQIIISLVQIHPLGDSANNVKRSACDQTRPLQSSLLRNVTWPAAESHCLKIPNGRENQKTFLLKIINSSDIRIKWTKATFLKE